MIYQQIPGGLDIVSVSRPAAGRPPQQRSHRWIAPEGTALKINVDGAVSRDGKRGAVSAICRDKDGKYLGSSAVTFDGLVDAASLEALACSEALALAKDLNLSPVIIGSDCMQVVSYIREKVLSSYAIVIDEIRETMNDFVSSSFRYECRETNVEAHAITKAASSLPSGRRLWLGILPNITCIPSLLSFE